MSVLLLWLLTIVGAGAFVIAMTFLDGVGDWLLDYWRGASVRRRVRRLRR